MRKIIDLTGKEQTGHEMHRLVKNYSNDIINFSLNGISLKDLPLSAFFNLVRSIKYVRDHKPIEIVKRPAYIIKDLSGDCKKKAVLMASYLYCNKIPYRFVSTSKLPNGHIHHVFTQGKINGKWINLDCTYDNYNIGEMKWVTAGEVI